MINHPHAAFSRLRQGMASNVFDAHRIRDRECTLDRRVGDFGPLPGGPYRLPALPSTGAGGGDSGVG